MVAVNFLSATAMDIRFYLRINGWNTPKLSQTKKYWLKTMSRISPQTLLGELTSLVRRKYWAFPELLLRTVFVVTIFPWWCGPIYFWVFTELWFGTVYPGLFKFTRFRGIGFWSFLRRPKLWNWMIYPNYCCKQLTIKHIPKNGLVVANKRERITNRVLLLWVRMVVEVSFTLYSRI